MTTSVLGAPVRVRGRYHRSVHIERDWHEQEGLSGYLLTPTARTLTCRIVDEARSKGGTRAWSITGPYGTGKSAFALFLTRFLANQAHNHSEAMELRASLGLEQPMLPILVAGQRAPLKPALLRGLRKAMEAHAPEIARETQDALSASSVSDAHVTSLYERASITARELGFGGIVLILDEFGKFLEHVAVNLDNEDLLIMQELAEVATRSCSPFILITILHTSFAAYLDEENVANHSEWQKVQGRFVDVSFHEPPEQLLRLVGEAIEADFPRELSRQYSDHISFVAAAPALEEVRRRLQIEDLLHSCVPLDPITALLLSPLFRSKLAQNERSLFYFLTSEERFGFQDFLRQAQWNTDTLPLYRLPRLYDYVGASLGFSAYSGNFARRWAEIDDAIDRIGADAPALASDVVKSVGLLWMYGSQVGLSASESCLKLALSDDAEVESALEYLKEHSILVYRRFEDAFALWEGSDVDLDERFMEALNYVGRGGLAGRLTRTVSLRPIVARAHYIETGTLRYFNVTVVDGVEKSIGDLLEAPNVTGDGQIAYVLTRDPKEREALISEAIELTNTDNPSINLRIFAFPKPIAGLETALREVEAWNWVRSNTPALEGDQVARKELLSHLRLATRRLESIAGKVLGLRGYRFEPNQSDWVQGGRQHELSDSRHLLKWLSSLCNSVFHKAPTFRNELLNRGSPSTAANSALYKLLRAMVKNWNEERFGLRGMPPEVSMYESLLRGGGFHHYNEHDGKWVLGKPNENWQAVWQEIERFLSTTHTQRRSITELYEYLEHPPYGMRQGPMPVLLVAMLIIRRGNVALYENSLFQPTLTEQLVEQIARNPGAFEVQEFVYHDATRELLAKLTEVVQSLGQHAAVGDESPLLRIARPLILFASRLPKYSKNTMHLSSESTIRIRDALLRARDPHDLLLSEIPAILGVSLQSADGPRKVAESLESALIELQRAYPELLDSIEQSVQEAFSLNGTTSREVQNSLAQRAAPLRGLATEPMLVAFIQRTTSNRSDEDWRENIGLVVVQRRAPRDWSDADRSAFQLTLKRLSSDFKRLEELAKELRRTGASKVIRVGLLDQTAKEVREIISLREREVDEVNALSDALLDVLTRYTNDIGNEAERRTKVAALSLLILRHLEKADEG